MNLLIKSIPVLSILLSACVAWMLFPIVNWFPLVACAIFFVGLSTLLFLVKKEKMWVDHILYGGVLLLSFFTIYRANEFLQFFDFLFIIFFISLLARSLNTVHGIVYVVLSPLTVFFNTLLSSNIFRYSRTLPTETNHKNYVKAYLPTLVLTLGVLLITIPLLASANPLFNSLLAQAFSFMRVDWLWSLILPESLAIYILRSIVFLFLSYMIPRALTVTHNGVKEYVKVPAISINYLIPKVALAGTLLVFFITQLQLYFASPELLYSLGYTNARLTQEVFFQVTVVAFIVLLLSFGDKSRKNWNRYLTYVLLLEALFLIAIAFKSVYDYSLIFGYTQKRLWGYTSMIWLVGTMGMYVNHYISHTSLQSLIRQVVAFSVVVIVFINLCNFDKIIYVTGNPASMEGVDYFYLSTRSVDAHYYADVLPQLMTDIQIGSEADPGKIQPARRMIVGIKNLRDKYAQDVSYNAFNITEYQEYLATKHLDIETYEKIISDRIKQQIHLNQSLTPNPIQ